METFISRAEVQTHEKTQSNIDSMEFGNNIITKLLHLVNGTNLFVPRFNPTFLKNGLINCHSKQQLASPGPR